MPSNKVNFFDLDIQYQKYKKILNQNILKTLKTSQYILGSEVKNFENRIAQMSLNKYAVGTSSGTDSLLISLLAIGVKKGDEIITSSFSWLSSVEVILLLGAKPVYVDINLNDFNMDIKEIEKKITKKTKAILSVSLFGYPCQIDEIKKIAKKKGITLIEDSAQSFGSKIRSKPISFFADITCYSFFPSKTLGAFGDAGGIVTNNSNIFKKLYQIRNHGQKYYAKSNKVLGVNGRLDEIQAAILTTKLTFFKKEISLRQKIAKKFIKLFDENNVSGYTITEKKKNHVYSQFSFLVKNRKKFSQFFSQAKIPIKIFYPEPLYKQYNQKLFITKKNTEFCCKHIVSIPLNIYSKKRFLKVYNLLKKIITTDEKIFYKKKYISNKS